MSKYTLLIIFILVYFTSFSQRGKNGDYTVVEEDEIVNTYTRIIGDHYQGTDIITVESNLLSGANFDGELEAGDLILLYNVQGVYVDVDITPTSDWGGDYTVQASFFNEFEPSFTEYGNVFNYSAVGEYEFNEVKEIIGSNQIKLVCPIQHHFFDGGRWRSQIVRVPRYKNLTIPNNTSITSPSWDGVTGGVVALEVDEELVLNGTIHTNKKGFRGGETSDNNGEMNDEPGAVADTSSRGYLGTYKAGRAGSKGESVYGTFEDYDDIYSRYGYGSIANGGGGGGLHNSGGGGGANVGIGDYYGYGVVDRGPDNTYDAAWILESQSLIDNPSAGGGRGGYSHANNSNNPLTTPPHSTSWNNSTDGGDFRRIAGGVGGQPLLYEPNRVYMGGGGGGGHQNDGWSGNGGAGGGVVFMNVYGTISGIGKITSNGADGENAEGPAPTLFETGITTGADGAGGAGAGGSVIIHNISSIPSTITLEAKGGKGGDEVIKRGATVTKVQANGPGGGGAGGLIGVSNGTPGLDVVGGASGITSATGGIGNGSMMEQFPVNGATMGADGISDKETLLFDIIAENDTVCYGDSKTITLEIVGNLNPSNIGWYLNYTDNTSFHSGTTYTISDMTSSAEFYVGSCDGSFRKKIEIYVSPELIIDGPTSVQNATCDDGGSITGINVSGGTGEYTYSWNGIETSSPNMTDLMAGDYTLVVTDEVGCEVSTETFTIVGESDLLIDLSSMVITGETCNGNDGSITGITVSGGTSPYTYEWNNNPANNSIDIVGSGGEYVLVVTDANGCSVASLPITIPSASIMSVDLNGLVITDQDCNGLGSISGIEIIGGTGILSYSWSNNGGNNLDITEAEAGSYTLTVTDESNCSITSGPHVVGVSDMPVIDETNMIITNTSCGENNGAIEGIEISGGQTPYTYEWNGSTSTDLDLNNLSAGDYVLTVTDANGCSITSDSYTIVGSSSIEIDYSGVVVTDGVCGNALGSIGGLTVTGGNGQLSYSWSNGMNTLDISGLPAGDYALTITDEQGCVAETTVFTIEVTEAVVINNDNVVITHATCGEENGSISGISIEGGTMPYSYTWNGVTSNEINVSDLGAGTYQLTVTDANGCEASSVYEIESGDGLTVNEDSVVITDVDCDGNGGSINGITVTGGTTPYTYQWNGETSNSINLNNASAGNYTLTVTDANGCSATSSTFVINQSVVPTVEIITPNQSIDQGESVLIETEYSSSDLDISWTPSNGLSCVNCENPIATPDESTWYVVTVVNDDGCMATDSIHIKINPDCREVMFPTIFTPNGDGLNDLFCVLGNCIQSMELKVFNRWGEVIFITNDVNECWDGTYKGDFINTGTYIYQFNGTLDDGTTVKKSGNINLVR